MPLVEITIAGRRHTVQCDDGEEPRLKRLAGYVDGKAVELAQANPRLGEARLLLLTSLTVADELMDSYEELHKVKTAGAAAGGDAAEQAIERVAARLERLAAALESA